MKVVKAVDNTKIQGLDLSDIINFLRRSLVEKHAASIGESFDKKGNQSLMSGMSTYHPTRQNAILV